MTYSLVLLRRAWEDLRRTMRWIEKRSPLGMTRWRDALDDCLRAIVQDPYRYEKAVEGSVLPHGVRQALFRTRQGNVYRVVFLVERNEVRILRIRGPGQRNLRPRDLR